jgi:hypothetical protein
MRMRVCHLLWWFGCISVHACNNGIRDAVVYQFTMDLHGVCATRCERGRVCAWARLVVYSAAKRKVSVRMRTHSHAALVVSLSVY